MKRNLLRGFRFTLLIAGMLCLSSLKSFATHIFGIDLYYQYSGGNNYKVILVVYGDCSGAAFPNLNGAVPEMWLYNGNTRVDTFELQQEPPLDGVEVTPVCPNDVNNTTCTNPQNTIPGIKKFVYSTVYTIPSASADWRFHFNGNMGATQAGRSSTITNVNNAGNTIITLDAKLNNLTGTNNSSVFGTIPTPFYCLNIPANYSPGSVDPELDSLYFVQIPGRNGTGLPNNPPSVTYINPYTATAPLNTAPGAFAFVPQTGQISFTPDAQQRSLACMEVQEYRNGVLVGTSQREMTVVVINSCSNWPPTGSITNAPGGTIIDSTTFRVCKSVGAFTFNINPTDLNGDTIDVTATGLPTGSTYTVTNNHTTAPTGVFSWNTTTVAPGTYTFTLNYQDNQCPLSAYQQITYRVIVAPNPSTIFNVISAATCTKKAVFTVDPGAATTTWTETVLQGATTIHTNTNLTGVLTDSLIGGTYTIRATNDVNCSHDTIVTMPGPPDILLNVTMKKPTCSGFSNGSINISAYNNTAPYEYAINAGAYGPSGLFSALASGTYTFHIRSATLCTKDTIMTLTDSLAVHQKLTITNIKCFGDATGQIIDTAYGGAAPYTYALNAAAFAAPNTFNGLTAATYTVHAKDNLGCLSDTTVTLTQPTKLNGIPSITNVLCNGDATGSITITATGGTPGYQYANGANPYGPTNVFSGLTAGTYTIHVRDTNSCIKDTIVTVTQPAVLLISGVTITQPTCNGSTDGKFVVTGSGGRTPYTYAINAGAYGATNTFVGLIAGTYTLHIKDANGCIHDSITVLAQPAVVDAVTSIKNSTCSTLGDGSVTLSGTGGTAPYTYARGANAYGAASTFSPLPAGSYVFHVKDSHGCIKDLVIAITDSLIISGDIDITNELCFGQSIGVIDVTGTGGGNPYTYAIDAGAFGGSGIFNGLPAGTYDIHIKDANGCLKDTSVAVTQPASIGSTINIVIPTCFGDSDATITVIPNGGTPPFTYALNAGTFTGTNIFTGLPTSIDIVHVLDNNGCAFDTSVVVGQPTKLRFADLIITGVKCAGGNDGVVQAFGIGGTPSYTFAADGGYFLGSNVMTPLNAGTHSIHIKDSKGCITDSSVEIYQPQPLSFASLGPVNPKCEGTKDGSVNLNGQLGTPPYKYSSDGVNYTVKGSFGGLPQGTYTYYIKDSNGCVADTAVTLVDNPHIVISDPVITATTCYDTRDGIIMVNASGGVDPLYYQVDGNPVSPVSTDVFTGMGPGKHIVTVTDANDCKKLDTVIVPQPGQITLQMYSNGNLCEGVGDNGAVYVKVKGGTPPFRYMWSTDPNHESYKNGINSLSNGVYAVTVADAHDCRAWGSAEVGYDNCCRPFVPNAFSPNNDGKNDIFRASFKGDMSLEKMVIYNRYGQEIFSSSNISQGWDGTYRGVPQDVGTYYFYMELYCGQGEIHKQVIKGDLVLVR